MSRSFSISFCQCLPDFPVCMMKRSVKSTGNDSEQRSTFHSTISFRKSCDTHRRSHQRIQWGQKLMYGSSGSIFTSTLKDASHIALHRVQCENERDLTQVLTRIELLFTILHCYLAHKLGCCIDSGYTPFGGL